MLVKILANNFWKIDVKFSHADKDYIDGISKNNAGLVIGDRTFYLKNSFSYQYDLAEEWFKYLNLSFVFLVGLANKLLSKRLKQQFSNALKYGVDNKALTVDQYTKRTNIGLDRYFSENISWDFDLKKEAKLKKFFSLCRNISLHQ